ncbi:hypothetical protein [Pseudovibrio sp. Tun.PSC04-5.I4]|uniref:hypothetical protein n=1 Tax=Pseudovibrio sp. Tun.PSC04-5.I4 TaxID=1798213 RepID=UPI00088E0BDB|nr:hypothetical protein [Pseudovibrio sp. Tun.PSC04-5.I4]SDR48946.1 hypothetical protein SAMN04515695_6093 [Pseudovibrio sp. Tun.PSC04-5.I4]
MKKYVSLIAASMLLVACQTTAPVTDENPPRATSQKSAQQVSAYLAKEFREQGYEIKTQSSKKVIATKVMDPKTEGQRYYADRSTGLPHHKLKVEFAKTKDGVEVIGWTGILMNPGTAKQYDFSVVSSADGQRLQGLLNKAAR